MKEITQYQFIDSKFYNDIKEVLEQARKRVYRNIQSEMVLAYWQIGKMIVERQGGNSRADYGDGLLKELSIQLTDDYGRGFDITNLRNMRKFYIIFEKRDAVRPELSFFGHYHVDRKINDKKTCLYQEIVQLL